MDAIKRMLETIKIEGTDACLSGYQSTKEGLSVTSESLENAWHPASCLINTWVANEIKYKECVEYLDGKFFFDKFKKGYKASFIPQALWKYRKRPGQKTAQPDHPNNKGA
jgi:hypothetical protein